MPGKRLSKETQDTICKLYLDGKSIAAIRDRTKIHFSTISYILKKNKLWKFKGARRYTCDFGFFKIINTEEKAYWLGFIAADGNISKPASKGKFARHCLHIGVHSKDEEHLKLFKKNIKANYKTELKTYISKGKPSLICKIDIYNEEIVKDLTSQGVHPAKSKTINWADFKIEKSLIRHFIRGFFDGDGSWSRFGKNKRGETKLKFCITCGSKDFIYPLQKFLSEQCDISLNKIEVRKDGNYALSWAGKDQMRSLYQYLYDNSNIFLKRKKDIIQNLLEGIPDSL